jgi:hypothetical protein
MKTLDEIAIEHQTDKATVFTRTYAKPKGFTIHYERFFAPLRFDKLNILEIGVAGGESIQMWLDYFECASVYGVDIVEKTNPWNDPATSPNPRYRFLQGSQSDKTMWECLKAVWGTRWDIVIDDGSHCNDDMITAYGCMWDCIVPGGYYAIEDLGAGYTPGSVHVKPGFPPHAQWLHAFVDVLMTSPGGIDSAYFANELVILRKRG